MNTKYINEKFPYTNMKPIVIFLHWILKNLILYIYIFDVNWIHISTVNICEVKKTQHTSKCCIQLSSNLLEGKKKIWSATDTWFPIPNTTDIINDLAQSSCHKHNIWMLHFVWSGECVRECKSVFLNVNFPVLNKDFSQLSSIKLKV